MSNPSDAEDVLQDVLFEFVRVVRGTNPIEDLSAWLHRVAANRIVDFFRKKKSEPFSDQPSIGDADEARVLEELLPSAEAGPDALYAREILLEAIADSLDALPAEQYAVFMAHEIEGVSFRELSARTGLSVNTLISRKHYAVQQLRRELQNLYRNFGDE